MIYNYFSDPSHGWLKVKFTELLALNIAHKITSCSYHRKEYVYLEEDCDYATFIRAKHKSGEDVRIKQHTTNKESKIRSYPRYTFYDSKPVSIKIGKKTYKSLEINKNSIIIPNHKELNTVNFFSDGEGNKYLPHVTMMIRMNLGFRSCLLFTREKLKNSHITTKRFNSKISLKKC